MIIRKLSREHKSYEAWNAFVDLLAKENYEALNEVQRVAYLCFWYDSEVQNGGHFQYFQNKGLVLLEHTLAALTVLGANCQRTVLQKAATSCGGKLREQIRTSEDYAAAARENASTAFDPDYYACRPAIQELLAHYLEKNKSHFIEVDN